MYWQGPIVKPNDFPANVSQLAFFRTEIHSNMPKKTTGEMINTPASHACNAWPGLSALYDAVCNDQCPSQAWVQYLA